MLASGESQLLDMQNYSNGVGRGRWERSQLAKAVTKMLAGGEPKALKF